MTVFRCSNCGAELCRYKKIKGSDNIEIKTSGAVAGRVIAEEGIVALRCKNCGAEVGLPAPAEDGRE